MLEFHIRFIGSVQGVGFRKTARDLALRMNMIGFVKNREDGSVEACIQGAEDVVFLFIENVKGFFSIREVLIEKGPVREVLGERFEIRW